jgi:DNA-binding Lrp family transcriptional regulator
VVEKPDRHYSKPLDEIDYKIIALKLESPRITVREIGDIVGLGKSAVWKRLHKIGDSDVVKQARTEFRALLPLVIHVYAKTLLNPKRQFEAARDIARLVGVPARRGDDDDDGDDGSSSGKGRRFRSTADVDEYLESLSSADRQRLISAGYKDRDPQRGDAAPGDAAARAPDDTRPGDGVQPA